MDINEGVIHKQKKCCKKLFWLDQVWYFVWVHSNFAVISYTVVEHSTKGIKWHILGFSLTDLLFSPVVLLL